MGEPMKLSDECKAFVKIDAGCESEIEEHCDGAFFGSDVMNCLTEWKFDKVGDSCKALLPKKEAADDTVDAEKAAWRAQRKAARGQAIKDIEKEKKRKEDEEKKEKKKRRKKAKKDQEL